MPAVPNDTGHLRGHGVARNTVFLSLADISGKVLMFAFYVVAARSLGVTEFGVLSFGLAFVTMFGVLSDLGLGSLATREIAQNRVSADWYVSASVSLKLLAVVMVIVMVILAGLLLHYDTRTVTVIGICSLSISDGAFTLYFASVFQGFERTEFTALSRLVRAVTLVVGALLLSRFRGTSVHFAALFSASCVASAVFSATMTSTRFVRLKLRFDVSTWRVLLKQATPFALAALFSSVYYWNGSTILSKMHSLSVVGLYSAAFRLVFGLSFVCFAFGAAMYPALSRFGMTNPGGLARIFNLGLRYISLLVMPVAITSSLLAAPIIAMVFGSKYAMCVPVFRILAVWAACAGVNGLLSNYMFATRHGRVATAQAGVSLAVNLLLNIVLIRPYGATGAAVAMLCAESVGLAYLTVALARMPSGTDLIRTVAALLRSATAAAGAGFTALLVVRLNPVVGIVTAAPLYVLFSVLTRALTIDDLVRLRSLTGDARPG